MSYALSRSCIARILFSGLFAALLFGFLGASMAYAQKAHGHNGPIKPVNESENPPGPGCEIVAPASAFLFALFGYSDSGYRRDNEEWWCPPRTGFGAVPDTQAGAAPSVMVSAGGASTCVFQKFTSTISLGGSDAFDPDTQQACGGEFVAGVTVQVPLFSAPNPFATVGNPPSIQREMIGFEFTFLDGTGSTMLRGTPVTAFPGPNTDQYNATDRFIGMADFTVTVPVAQSVSVLGRAGIAVLDKQVTYDCTGYCAAAGLAPFSQSQSVWQPGFVIGGGVTYTPSGSPVTFEADISHIFTDQKNFEFGQPATISTAFNVSQGVTVATVGAKITAFELEHMFNFRY